MKNIIVKILKKLRMYSIVVIIIGWMSARQEELNKKTIKQLLQKEDPVVLELGACDGWDTKRFLREFRDIRIYCFEPDPRNLAILQKSIKDDRCVVVEAAVSNKDGEAILHMSTGWPRPLPRWLQFPGLSKAHTSLRKKEWTASSSIVESVPHSEDLPWLTFDRVAGVKAVKLDTWVREENIVHVDFIWMDVQGAERGVIEGAADTLKMTNFVFTEFGETSTYPEAMTGEETIEIMKEHGFDLVPEYSAAITAKRGNLLFRNKAFKAKPLSFVLT